MMLTKENPHSRQVILNEIVSTLEFIDFLKYESRDAVNKVIKREELKKNKLIEKLNQIEV